MDRQQMGPAMRLMIQAINREQAKAVAERRSDEYQIDLLLKAVIAVNRRARGRGYYKSR